MTYYYIWMVRAKKHDGKRWRIKYRTTSEWELAKAWAKDYEKSKYQVTVWRQVYREDWRE